MKIELNGMEAGVFILTMGQKVVDTSSGASRRDWILGDKQKL